LKACFTVCLNNKKRLVLLAFFYSVFLVACSKPSPQMVQFEGPTMGTRYSVKLVVGQNTELDIPSLQTSVDQRLAQINQAMSTYIDDSDINQLNAAPAGTDIKVSAELCEVLKLSQDISAQTEGAFDISVGPIVRAWGFGPEQRDKPPEAELLMELLSRTGYQYLNLDCNSTTVLKQKALSLDLSAVAKGYAVDVISELITQETGISDVMVEIGGELSLRGSNVEGKAWRIGIEKPALAQMGATQVLALSNVAVATSGDYRNFYEFEGQHYSHLIDPKTGRPVEHALTSVTIVSKNCALADAYATAIHVMGPEAGLAFAEKNQIAAFFIERSTEQFRYYHTQAFEQYMRSQ
jgi:thiamine biosynthesis lipoprotein